MKVAKARRARPAPRYLATAASSSPAVVDERQRRNACGLPPTPTPAKALACARSSALGWRVSENATNPATFAANDRITPPTSALGAKATSAAGLSHAIARGPCARKAESASPGRIEGKSSRKNQA